MYCLNCGKPLDPGTKFCRHCGTRVPMQETPHGHNAPEPQKHTGQYCRKCGRKLAASDTFCPGCGQRAGTPAPSQPEQRKKSKKKIIGWVLIGLQTIATVPAIANGTLVEILKVEGLYGSAQLLGFFLAGMIGFALVTD